MAAWGVAAPDLLERIAGFMLPNDIACSLRFIDKATAACFDAPRYKTIHLSQPCSSDGFKRRWGVPGAMRGLSLEQRRKLLCLVARSGSFDNFQVAVGSAGLLLTSDLLTAAAAGGQLDICRWLRQQGCPWGQAPAALALGGHHATCMCIVKDKWTVQAVSVLAAAAWSGRLPLVEWLLEAGCPWDDDAVLLAACAGHGDLMQRLLHCHVKPSVSPAFAHEMLMSVALGCDLATLQRLYGEWAPRAGGLSQVPAAAACSHTADWREKVTWLEEHGACWYTAAWRVGFCPAALERLVWLRELGCSWYAGSAFSAAAVAGNAAAVRYLLDTADESLDIDHATLQAANGCHVEVLEALLDAGAEMRTYVFDKVLSCGLLPVVVRVVEQRRQKLDRYADSWAAQSGSLEVMSYVYERVTERSPLLYADAAAGGNAEALDLLVQRGLPAQKTHGWPYIKAGLNGDMATLRYLRRRGFPWGPFHEAVMPPPFLRGVRRAGPVACPLPVLAWMLAAGCPVDWDAALAAARQRPADGEEVAAWLAEQHRRLQYARKWKPYCTVQESQLDLPLDVVMGLIAVDLVAVLLTWGVALFGVIPWALVVMALVPPLAIVTIACTSGTARAAGFSAVALMAFAPVFLDIGDS